MARFIMCLVAVMAMEVSPVQKVIQLLDELKVKVENDLANEAAGMEEYTNWCDEEANTKEDAITSSKRTIQDLQATIEDSHATIQSLTSEIDELTGKISTSESDLSKATSIRDNEHKDFQAAEKELVETVDSLERSTSVLKKNLGFLQTGKVAKEFGALANGLSKIVEASWVNIQQKEAINSFLQSQTQTDDEDLEYQPQAATSSYQSQSSGIIDTIVDMQEKAEESLSSTRKNEMESAHAYTMLKQGLEDEIAVMKKQLGDSTLTRSTTEEELHAAEAGLTETQATLKADAEYLEQLKQSCATKASQWSNRQKNAGEETAAIEKAKGILSDGVKVLLQTSSKTEVDGARAEVVGILKGLSKKFKSYALVELSNRASSDPFGKIRGLIEGMINKLTKDAAAEADQKSFCDEEMSESKAKQADLNGKLDKNTARIESAEAGKAKLTQDISTLEAEVADIDAGQAEATKMRQAEKTEYTKASSDFKDSAAAVAKAIEVLDNYYNNAALVQTSQPDMDFGSAKGDIGSTIVSILEVAESDFTQLLAEAEAEESSAQSAYDKLSQENAVTKATKQSDAKGKGNEVKQLEVSLSNLKENKETTSNELDAVLAYLDKLKPQCETKVESYAERKARREQEIAGLKEAMTILSGESLLQISSLRGIRRA